MASSRKPVRAPFVVTIAVLATAACGGQVSAGDPADGGTTTETAPPDTPTNPQPIPTTCPAAKPIEGTDCALPAESNYCGYGDCSTGGEDSWTCETGKWRNVGRSSCNPPPPECPSTEPTEGAPCDTYGWGGCYYADLCPARPADAPSGASYQCMGGAWTKTAFGEDYELACPTATPAQGDACECAGHYPSACSYGDCYGTPTITARCDAATRTWSVAMLTCNPPPPELDAGAEPAP
jgi:hypothetical protein